MKIFYLENNTSGLPLFFIHGWLGNSFEWLNQLCYFNTTDHVISLDLPGFGKSDKPKTSYSIDFFSDLILNFLETLGYDEVILIGHSLGGLIAQDIVFKKPTIVKRLILISTSNTFSRSLRERFILFWVKIFFELNYKNFLKNIIKQILSTNYENREFKRHYNKALKIPKFVVLNTFKNMTSNMINDHQLSSIKQPTLIIYGREDKIISKSKFNNLENLINASEVHVIKNSHHRVMVENYTKVNKLIENFIRK
ncbi:MAG: alpha/beta fold hydrolase [Promethearchaeota archaeon]